MAEISNRLTKTLGIDYPIVQGPLGGLSSQRLTAAVSNFGGLGSFGALTLAPDAISVRGESLGVVGGRGRTVVRGD
jgi:NAD(P)H-dependent flavin oxidoreductase YrpB (nitropropane dioxygenase family)